jgi:hypothetical protein
MNKYVYNRFYVFRNHHLTHTKRRRGKSQPYFLPYFYIDKHMNTQLNVYNRYMIENEKQRRTWLSVKIQTKVERNGI